jgi:hypothetical protein
VLCKKAKESIQNKHVTINMLFFKIPLNPDRVVYELMPAYRLLAAGRADRPVTEPFREQSERNASRAALS